MNNAILTTLLALAALALTFATGCGTQTTTGSHDDAHAWSAVQTSKHDAKQNTPNATGNDVIDSIIRVVRANYKAMENKESDTVLSLYHPKTNLKSSKQELDQFFSRMDVTYDIKDIRYIGSDGINNVIIYHEITEFRIRNDPAKKVVDKEDTDVLMVLRKHDGKFKIYTSCSLKPGM